MGDTTEKESFDFNDVQEIFVEVKLAGREFHLVEATSDTARQFRNLALKGYTLGANGKPVKVQGLADLETFLVSACLFEVKDGKRETKPVSEHFVRMLKARIVKPLFAKAKEISEMQEAQDAIWVEAFSREDAPCSLEKLREWVEQLPDKYEALKDALEETDDEKVKND